ncbi:hypothetical protein D3C85_957740 [compost metagenome]
MLSAGRLVPESRKLSDLVFDPALASLNISESTVLNRNGVLSLIKRYCEYAFKLFTVMVLFTSSTAVAGVLNCHLALP